MPPRPKPLSPKQVAWIDAVARGESYKDAAQTAGVAYQTAMNWRRLPGVRVELDRIADDRIAYARDSGRLVLPKAIQVLIEIMENDEANDRDRISACKELLDRLGMPKATEVRTVEKNERTADDVLADARNAISGLRVVAGGKG